MNFLDEDLRKFMYNDLNIKRENINNVRSCCEKDLCCEKKICCEKKPCREKKPCCEKKPKKDCETFRKIGCDVKFDKNVIVKECFKVKGDACFNKDVYVKNDIYVNNDLTVNNT